MEIEYTRVMASSRPGYTHMGERVPGTHYFTAASGNHWRSTSKYMPHQNKRECTRRRKQMERSL